MARTVNLEAPDLRGWPGYDDDKLRRRCREALAQGWRNFKIKVGRNLAEDGRCCAILRQEIGPGRRLTVDANRLREVDQATGWMHALSGSNPWWIEGPLCPDDVVGHGKVARAVRPIVSGRREAVAP
ncbi:MAG TPA: enolase C-terminal domain-like protein [Steroidobacteraceae bacterium]